MREIKWMGAAIGLFCLAGSALGENPKVVGKLESADPVQLFHERPRIVVKILTTSGQQMQIGVENANEDLYNVDPKEVLVDEIKEVKPGDLVDIEYYLAGDQSAMLVRLVPYVMEPGMDLPNAYIFHGSRDYTENQQNVTLLDVKRFEQPTSFLVPGKVDGNTMTPDPDLMAAIGKLKDGQTVVIDALPGKPYPILKSIEAYTAPQAGVLKAIKIGELDGNKTTEADIDVDGTAVTAYVPGHLDGKRWIVDSKVLAELRRLRTNSKVLFRVVDDKGQSLLREIKAAPKDAPKPEVSGGGSK